jgi:uncharacterized protein (TIGR03084 family)
MQQAADFLAESASLVTILEPLRDDDFARETLFKGWTIGDVLGHLHMFNHAANLALQSSDEFKAFFAPIVARLKAGTTLIEIQQDWLGGLSGRALFEAWRSGCEQTGTDYSGVDPKVRVKWAGPDMSARSCITARQMETWAHGQAVFDALGLERRDTDRIKNIAHLGVTTFRWTFVNRGEEAPEPPPFVKLDAPSGAIWEWNEPQTDSRVEGSATEFCQVVTQVRNIADTSIRPTGAAAARWMKIAQCFAGPPEAPPAPGSRHISTPERTCRSGR